MSLFSLYFNLILLAIFSIQNGNISSIYPIYKILLSENVDYLDSSEARFFNQYLNPKGIGLIFDFNTNISIIPINLFSRIFYFYHLTYYEFLSFRLKDNGDYQEIILYDKYKSLELIHFILENMGIVIPLDLMFTLNSNNEYIFRFIGKKDAEYIVFGKDLIDLMNIEFKSNNYFEIHNKNFIVKFGDEG